MREKNELNKYEMQQHKAW